MAAKKLKGWKVQPYVDDSYMEARDFPVFLDIERTAGVVPYIKPGSNAPQAVISEDKMTISLKYVRANMLPATDKWDLGFRLGDIRGSWTPLVICTILHSADTHEETIEIKGAGSGGDAEQKPHPRMTYLGSVFGILKGLLLRPGKRLKP